MHRGAADARAWSLRRSARRVETTTPVANLACSADPVNPVFRAPRPNALSVADITHMATWAELVHVAFVIDTYVGHIVGWRVSSSLRTNLALDALEHALYERAVSSGDVLVHRRYRRSQYLSIRCYMQRFAAAGTQQSVGSVSDSFDNALAKPIIVVYKTEVIRPQGRWRGLVAGEFATLGCVAWFNHRRLHRIIRSRRPAEAETAYIANESIRCWLRDSTNTLPGVPGGV